MARSFLTAVNLNKNELQNAAVQNLGTAPSSPVKGQLYFNSSDNTLYWWDGTAWVPAKDGGGAGFPGYGVSVTAHTTFGQTTSLGAASTVSRSDHSHGTPAHNAAEHSTIPLSALAAATAPINMGGYAVTNVGTPANPGDAANKTYVDGIVNGLSWKAPCQMATTANIALTGAPTIDGINASAGYHVLVKNQTTATENGVYISAAGAWTRRADLDSGTEFPGAAVFVTSGTTQADTQWTCSNDTVAVGSTAITWVQVSGPGVVTAGSGLTQAGNVLNVIAGDTSLTVAADDVRVNTSVIATTASLAGYVPTSRSVVAGTGLTGGGALSADATLNVVGDATITVTADQIGRAALTGDVTAIAGSNLTAIPNDTVNNAKLANMAALTIKGNNTAGTADPADLTKAQFATMMAGTMAQTFAADVGGSTAQVITHNIGHKDVVISVHRQAAPFDTVECDVERTSTTTATLRFAVAPSANEYRVVVVG